MEYLDGFGLIPKTETQVSLYLYFMILFGVTTLAIGSKLKKFYGNFFTWIVLAVVEIPFILFLYSLFYFRLIPVQIPFLNMLYWTAITFPIFICVRTFTFMAVNKLKLTPLSKKHILGIACFSCGYENKIGSHFCGKCGHELEKY